MGGRFGPGIEFESDRATWTDTQSRVLISGGFGDTIRELSGPPGAEPEALPAKAAECRPEVVMGGRWVGCGGLSCL
jgi:hypothetical protein